MEGVPSLTAFVKGVTDDVADPRQWKPLGTLWHDSAYAAWQRTNKGVAAADRPEFHLEMGPLGSGSDYTAFLDHAGIPSVDVDMSGPYGVYHATYDDFHWFDTYGDPEWNYTPTMGKVLALLALRTADADVLPYRYSEYGRKIEDYIDDLEKANLDADGKPRYALDLSGVRSTAKEIRETAADLEGRIEAALAANALDAGSAAALNDALMSVEGALTDDRGLPRRPWFRHMIYAPGFYTGYASLPLPGPAQAIRDRDEPRMRSELGKVEAALGRAKSRLDAAAAALPGRGRRGDR
jgi:N-acetylated-alpha-linked acidic dipeptidase